MAMKYFIYLFGVLKTVKYFIKMLFSKHRFYMINNVSFVFGIIFILPSFV